MAIIGVAYVEIRAITNKINSDIESALKRNSGAGEAAGRDYGNKFANGLRSTANNLPDFSPKLNDKDFKSSSQEIERLTSNTRNVVQRETSKIEQAFINAGRGSGSGFISGLGEGNISHAVSRIASIVLLATPAIGALISAISALVSGLFSIASAVAPAANALAVLPGLAAAAGSSILTLGLAFKGIGAAYKAGSQAASGAGAVAAKAAKQTAAAVESSKKQIVAAQRAVRDATENVAKVAHDSAEKVASAQRDIRDAYEARAENNVDNAKKIAAAEKALSDAQNVAYSSQAKLDKARKDAAQNLIDMQNALEQSSIDEGQAQLALEKAQRAFAQVKDFDPNSTLYRQASLNLRQAQLTYNESIQNNKDAAQANADAQSKGVEGADEVVKAHQDQADAATAVTDAVTDLSDAQQQQAKDARDDAEAIADAQQKLKDATYDAAIARRDAAEQLADAQQRLADAHKALTTSMDAGSVGAAGGVNQFNQAMKNLSPQAQAFVRYLLSIRGEFLKLQAAAGEKLFPALTTALQTIISSGFLKDLADMLRDTGGAIGYVAIQIANLTKNKDFRKNFNIISDSNVVVIKNFGDALRNMIGLFATLAAAAAPVTEEFSAWIAKITGNWAKSAQDNFDGLRAKIIEGAGVIKQLGRIFSLLWDNIKLVAASAKGAGQGLIDSFEGALTQLRTFLSAPGQDKKMQKYFEDVANNVRALGTLFNNLAVVFIKLGDNQSLGKIADKLSALAPVIGGVLEKSLDQVGPIMADLVGNIVEIFHQLTANGAGLQSFISTLNTLAGALSAVFNIPGVGPAVTKLVEFMGIWKAVDFVAKATGIRKMAGAIGSVVTNSKAFVDGIRGVSSASTEAAEGAAKFGKALRANAVVQKIATAVAAVWNAVMAANPIILIVAGIVALIAALVLFFTKTKLGKKIWADFTEAMSKAWKGITKAFSVAWDAIQDGFDWVKKNWKTILAIITGPIGLAVKFIIDHWDGIKKIFQGVIDWVKDHWVNILLMLVSPVALAVKWVVDHWDDVTDAFKSAIDWVKNNWKNIVNLLTAPIQLAIDGIKTIWKNVTAAFKSAIDWVKNNWTTIVSLLTGPIGLAVGAIGKNWDKVKTGVQSVRDKIVSAFTSAVDWLKGVPNKVWGALSATWTRFTTAVAGVRETVINRFTAIVTWLKGVPGRVGSALAGVWNSVTSTLDGAKTKVTGKFNEIVGFVKGLPSKIATAALGMWDGIWTAFKSMFNKIIDGWNSLTFTVGGGTVLGVKIPSVTFATPHINRLATGGIVKATPGGVPAIMGEAGRDEKVTPLGADGLSTGEREIVTQLRQLGTAMRPVQIIVQAAPGMNETELAIETSRRLAFLDMKA